jgi:WD40 repeat protein
MSSPDKEPGRGPADLSGRLWALFDQAADLPPAERQTLLDAACADDPGLCAEVERMLARHSGEVVTARYSPDGEWIASAGTDRTIRVWRASERQDVAILHGHTGTVIELAFSRDGRRLASQSYNTGIHVGTGDSTVRVWEVDPQATLPVLRGHTSYIYPVVFSHDGRWIASGGWDGEVRLWDATTGEPCATFPHPSFVLGLAFGPDATWLVTGCRLDDRLRICDVATARVRKEIPLPDMSFHSLALSQSDCHNP